jgi:hypothetical protein
MLSINWRKVQKGGVLLVLRNTIFGFRHKSVPFTGHKGRSSCKNFGFKLELHCPHARTNSRGVGSWVLAIGWSS